ncbi:MAG: autotransporter domain-containing protein [Parvibaculaceae bacterium]
MLRQFFPIRPESCKKATQANVVLTGGICLIAVAAISPGSIFIRDTSISIPTRWHRRPDRCRLQVWFRRGRVRRAAGDPGCALYVDRRCRHVWRTVEFDDETSVRGRLGLRLGYDHTAANAVVYSSDVTASVCQEFNDGSIDASIVTADFPAFGVSDEPGETVGDISVGFSIAAPDGWSGFLRGNYRFSDDLNAIAGSAGLRYSW